MIVDGEKLRRIICKAFDLAEADRTEDGLRIGIKNIARDLADWRDREPLAQARIEAAIRELDEKHARGATNFRYGECADLLRYFLGQEQDTWTDEDFGLDKEQEEK